MRNIVSYCCISVFIVLLYSCVASKSNSYTDSELKGFEETMNNKSFIIKAEWANPLVTPALNTIGNSGLIQPGNTINRIDLSGFNSYLKMDGDRIMANLPYYGERQISTSYGSRNTGILLDGPIDELKTDFNKNKNRYELSFQIIEDVESYQVSIFVFPNKKAVININSSHRTNISYGGVLNTLKEL